jgi:hypothetical protein
MSPDILERWVPVVAPLLVLPPWIWLAVRTKHCLQIISGHTVPYQRRTIWLIKVLALIVGAGGVVGAAAQIGIPWFLAIVPAGIVVFFALTDNVQEIVPPKPNQDASAYQSSWQQYRRLRSDFMRSWRWIVAPGLMLIFLAAFGDTLPKFVQIGLFALFLLAVLASSAVMSLKQLRWLRWPCPRCGCAFRGFWSRPLMPKSCVYCGLPREDNAKLAPISSR